MSKSDAHIPGSVLFVDSEQLRSAVRFENLIEPVSRAFMESSAGLAENGLIVLFPAEAANLGEVYIKAGTLRGHDAYVVKISPWFAINDQRGQPQGGLVAIFDSRTGHTLALLKDEHYLSAIRTAAAGAVAAQALAPEQVKTAAVLGSGEQAFWQPQSLYRVRPFEILEIWARNAAKAALLQEKLGRVLPSVTIRVSTDLEGTVRAADVLITATQAREPLVRGEWLHEGQHVTAVGADDATKCELDSCALKRSRVFVDSIKTTTKNGDVYRAMQKGDYTMEQVSGEIGEVLAKIKPGRQSRADITIAKFVGIGVQDLVAAEVALSLVNRP